MQHSGEKKCLCGKTISATALQCSKCACEQATLNSLTMELLPVGVTHILISYPSQDREDLYRVDGMLIAARHGSQVTVAIEPKEPAHRIFINPAFAAAWLRRVAGLEIITRHDGQLRLADVLETGNLNSVNIYEKSGESLIIQPGRDVVQAMRPH